MSENQEKNNIIESYDGDPDDLVFFQAPVDEEYDLEEDLEDEEIEEEVIEIHREISSEPEVVIYENDTVETVSLNKEENQENKQFLTMTSGIDLNDPHYANYQLDPYYDFGQGPEPEAKKVDDKKDGTSLGVVSLCTAIAANLMCCCGMNYILSLTAIVTGIWCLCMKNTDKSAKIMSIIGIILALLPFAVLLLNLFSTVFIDLYNYVN